MKSLEVSKILLPTAARKFQDWHVGILERFDVRDVGLIDEEVTEITVAPDKEVVGKVI